MSEKRRSHLHCGSDILNTILFIYCNRCLCYTYNKAFVENQRNALRRGRRLRVVAPNPLDRFFKNLKSVSYIESFLKIPIFHPY